MDTTPAKQPEHVYLMDVSGQETLAFLCPYRLFAKLSDFYKTNPKEYMIRKDFHEMETAFGKGESLEMIHGITVRRVPLLTSAY